MIYQQSQPVFYGPHNEYRIPPPSRDQTKSLSIPSLHYLNQTWSPTWHQPRCTWLTVCTLILCLLTVIEITPAVETRGAILACLIPMILIWWNINCLVVYRGRIQREGGQGVWPPLLFHDVGFLTLAPKLDPRLDPPFFACRPNLDPPPLSKILDPPRIPCVYWGMLGNHYQTMFCVYFLNLHHACQKVKVRHRFKNT